MKTIVSLNILTWLIFSISFSQIDHNYIISYNDTYHGLPQNTIFDIAVKKKQFITVVTTNGIVTFDGNIFYEFIENVEYKNNLYSRIVWHPKQDTLYGYGTNGMYKRIYPQHENKQKLQAVFFGDTKITYITQRGKIIESDYELNKQYNTTKTQIIDANIIFNAKNAYYVANRTKLYKIDKKTNKQTVLKHDKFNITKIKKNPYTQEIYFLSTNKIYILAKDRKSLREKNVQNEEFVNNLHDIEFINDTTYVVASSAGLIFINNNSTINYFPNREELRTATYSVYYYREENCLLVGTENRGLMKLYIQQSYTLQADKYKIASFISMVKDGNSIYSACIPNNIVRFNNYSNIEQYLSIPNAVASLSHIDNQLYIGTWDAGLLVYKNQQLTQHIKVPTLPSQSVLATFKDHLNNIWIATTKGVVVKTPQGRFENISEISSNIGIIYQLQDSSICLGGSDGVYIVKNNKIIVHLDKKNGLICREVRSFYQDEQNILWIGTYNGGLYRYDIQQKELLSINNLPHCMLNENIFTIVKGMDDLLYMSSNQGIFAVYKKKLNDFANGNIPYLIPFFIGKTMGMDNMEFNGGFQNNYLYHSHKTIYFPSIEGIVKVDQRSTPFRELYPLFTSVLVDNVKHSLSHRTFPANTKNIYFNFFAFSCIDKYNVFYQYRLVSKSKTTGWSVPQKNNSLSLNLLPSGDYKLYLRALDGFNDKFPQEKVISFTILPRFYETTTFYIFISTFSLSLIVYIIIKYTRYIRVEDAKQHKIEQTIAELKIHNIQLQMNPHFIFNSLNNIIYLLNINKLEEAERILLDFSTLLRMYLEKSTHSFLTIAEELEIIRLYLEIQKQRFQEHFTYSIICPDSLLNEVIPNMLIQPFVENAIVHGFAHSEQIGKLIVEVKQTEQHIQLSITDNGIGRQRSTEINKHRRQHKSLGMDIVKQKIKVIYQKYKIKIDLLIEDLEQGTSIIIKIKR